VRALILLIILNPGLVATAQRVELGTFIGLSNYTGDVAPKGMILSETKWAAGFLARYNFNNTWAFTASATQLRIGGSDKNVPFNQSRNITFRTDITEFSGVFEFNYFRYGTGVLDNHFTPYVYWGLGAAIFNPQGQYKNEWYDLRDYRTEGKSYGSVTMIMPMGIGLKWMPSKNMSVEWLLGLRKTYTDYLDDVSTVYPDLAEKLATQGEISAALSDPSMLLNEGVPLNKPGYQRGNPDYKDWYYTTQVTLTYRIFSRIKCSRFY
jgi:hypothetical protein